jgi:hypothetical protein
MRRLTLAAICYLSVLAGSIWGQSADVKPVRIPAGTVLTFYLQTRLNPTNGNVTDLLPKGTELNIKILDAINSDVTRDGAEFRGLTVSPVISHDEVIIHADSEVRGLFALLRSRSHPDGFRYELLITGISDGGKLFQLTASLNPSFMDSSAQSASAANSASKSDPTAIDGKNSSSPTQK